MTQEAIMQTNPTVTASKLLVKAAANEEGTGTGWSDDRLMQAYDLIHGVWADLDAADFNVARLKSLLFAIEAADEDINEQIRDL